MCEYICVCLCVYVCKNMCVYIYIYIYMYMCVCIYIYLYIYIYCGGNFFIDKSHLISASKSTCDSSGLFHPCKPCSTCD